VLIRATGVHSVVYNSANADAYDGTMNTSDQRGGAERAAPPESKARATLYG
jgi:hypothetical protein